MPQLIWSDKAASDLEDIHDYIAKDSIFYAIVQVDRLMKSVERLQAFPESGRTLPEYQNTPYREVIHGSYRIIYRYESAQDRILIITVAHASRLITNILR